MSTNPFDAAEGYSKAEAARQAAYQSLQDKLAIINTLPTAAAYMYCLVLMQAIVGYQSSGLNVQSSEMEVTSATLDELTSIQSDWSNMGNISEDQAKDLYDNLYSLNLFLTVVQNPDSPYYGSMDVDLAANLQKDLSTIFTAFGFNGANPPPPGPAAYSRVQTDMQTWYKDPTDPANANCISAIDNALDSLTTQVNQTSTQQLNLMKEGISLVKQIFSTLEAMMKQIITVGSFAIRKSSS
ncbi:MAG: hypothetical protein JSS61_05415 [Verrucomicrobia bacterium]|nr:hypothetical protein [Verrucomicrobiota bacterium]